MVDYLQGLNEQQQEAVLHKDGPLMIVAGAGSGKTKVLTTRIAHLMAKFAPSTLAAIIDNSSYAQPPMNYLGIGDEGEFTLLAGAAAMDASVRSAWTVSDRHAPQLLRPRPGPDPRLPLPAAPRRRAGRRAGPRHAVLHGQRDGGLDLTVRPQASPARGACTGWLRRPS